MWPSNSLIRKEHPVGDMIGPHEISCTEANEIVCLGYRRPLCTVHLLGLQCWGLCGEISSWAGALEIPGAPHGLPDSLLCSPSTDSGGPGAVQCGHCCPLAAASPAQVSLLPNHFSYFVLLHVCCLVHAGFYMLLMLCILFCSVTLSCNPINPNPMPEQHLESLH